MFHGTTFRLELNARLALLSANDQTNRAAASQYCHFFSGFDYDDSIPFTGDSTSHQVTWKEQHIDSLTGREIDSLTGRELRLEFLLTRADLFTFRAVEAEGT
jgi:hypothetical protein